MPELVAGVEAELECRVAGGQPQPHMVWAGLDDIDHQRLESQVGT